MGFRLATHYHQIQADLWPSVPSSPKALGFEGSNRPICRTSSSSTARRPPKTVRLRWECWPRARVGSWRTWRTGGTARPGGCAAFCSPPSGLRRDRRPETRGRAVSARLPPPRRSGRGARPGRNPRRAPRRLAGTPIPRLAGDLAGAADAARSRAGLASHVDWGQINSAWAERGRIVNTPCRVVGRPDE